MRVHWWRLAALGLAVAPWALLVALVLVLTGCVSTPTASGPVGPYPTPAQEILQCYRQPDLPWCR